MIKKISLFFISAFLALAPAAFAESYHYSESEKAVFSFFKLSHGEPNYESWINASPNVASIVDTKKKAELYEQESLRLKWGFGTFDVTRDFLKINTDVVLSLTRTKGKTLLNFMFPNAKSDEIPYFPYAYGSEWIALVVEDLGNYTHVPLTQGEEELARKYISEGQIYPIKLVVRARMKKADSAEPLMLDGMTQWIMSGEVGHIEFVYKDPKTGEEITLWKLTAPWYLTDTEKMLMPLLDENISNKPPSN